MKCDRAYSMSLRRAVRWAVSGRDLMPGEKDRPEMPLTSREPDGLGRNEG